jgi:2-polyprenyl-3-methyl-5-hydroxy-6-metoxy-1,4-benzoquinol methylase
MTRQNASTIARQYLARGDGKGWFEQVYRTANGNSEQVPWADLRPHPLLVDWLAGLRFGPVEALDVGCGLGDNAEALADAGMNVTAFDLSPTATRWARQRFAGSQVKYQSADLFSAPGLWRQKFDLVSEIYTLQSLPKSMRPRAIRAIAGFIKPGGTLLVICRGREENKTAAGPPWPLAKSEIMTFTGHGFTLQCLDVFEAYDNGVWPRFRFVFKR